MKKKLLRTGLALLILLAGSTGWVGHLHATEQVNLPPWQTGGIPEEVAELLIGMWVDPAGLRHYLYDLDGDGKADFETIRRQTIFILLPDNTVLINRDESGSPCPYWERYPFIYYVDLNRNGKYEKEEMFLDRESDGINGNEEYLLF